MKRGKDSKQGKDLRLFGGESPDAHGINVLTEEDEALLARLAAASVERRASEQVEQRFRRHHPDLHFELRNRFGSYCSALAVLLKQELGSPLTRKQLLGWLKALYATGEAVTLESIVKDEPRIARALIEEFGTLRLAWAELGIDATTAGQDRRWDQEKLFYTAVDTLAGTAAALAESELASEYPLFCEAVRHTFGSFPAFRREFTAWVKAQPCVYALFGRWQLGKMLAGAIPETSRGAKGKRFPPLTRLQGCYPVAAGQRVFVVTNLGLLVPVDSEAVPFVGPNTPKAALNFRLAGLKRGEKPIGLVSWAEPEGYLGLATKGGRLKIIDLSLIKRVRSPGVLVVNLTGKDRVTAAGIVPQDFERLMVVTRHGRAVAFEQGAIRPSSRRTMGVHRIRFDKDRKDEPAAVLGFRGYDDLLLLARAGNVLRVCNKDVSTRKGASMGRRVWKSAVADATACAGDRKVVVCTKRTRVLCYSAVDVPRRQVLRQGVIGVRLDSDDGAESINCF